MKKIITAGPDYVIKSLKAVHVIGTSHGFRSEVIVPF